MLALLAIMIGIAATVGRLTDIAPLATFIPGSSHMSFNSAWMLVLCGLVLCMPENPRTIKIRNYSGVAIICAGMILLFLIFLNKNTVDVLSGNATPFSLPELMRSGLIAPNSCVAFIFLGISFLMLGQSNRVWSAFWLCVTQAATVVMVVKGLSAYYVDFNELFSWYDFNRMSVPTGSGILAIVCAIWQRQRRVKAPSVRAAAAEGVRIVILGALLLSSMGLAAGMAGFAVFMNYQEQATGNQLVSSAVSLTRLYETLIDDGIEQAVYVSDSTSVSEAVEQYERAADKRAVKDHISKMLNDFSKAGFSNLRLFSRSGELLGSSGIEVTTFNNSIPISYGRDSRIVFGSDFYLQMNRDVVDSYGNVIGRIHSERPLTKLRDSYFSVSKIGKTADSILCGMRADDAVNCFPSVLTNFSLVLPKVDKRVRLPIDDALIGKTGTQKATDYRGKRVLAAYAPVGDTGLGAVLKMDVFEMYAPIRQLLEQVMVILVCLLLAGVVALKKMMVPVVNRIVQSQETAEESVVHIQAIVDHIFDGIITMDASGRITTFNKACEAILGFRSGEVAGMHFTQLLSPRYRVPAAHFFDAYKRPDYNPALKTERHRLSAVHKDGREIFIEMGTNELRLNNEITYVGIIHDITESRAARVALERSEMQLRTITENVPAGIAYFDTDARVLFANRIYASWLGHQIQDVQNECLSTLMPSLDFIQAEPYINKVLKGQEVSYEHISMQHGEKQPRATHVTYLADRDGRGVIKGFFALITDITERKNREEMLTHLANHDTLTNLPNRRLFNDRLKQAMIRSHRYQTPIALFTLDVDHFKKINDSMGHDIGDELLKTLSNRLQAAMRDSDTVARMGGDEFTILLEEIEDLEALQRFADKLLVSIREPMMFGSVTLTPSSSVGIAVYCADNITLDAFMKISDTALYAAKANGRNGYHIAPSRWAAKGKVLRAVS